MVPDPWAELATTDLVLCHVDMPEMGRYYHRQRVIMLRRGLLLVEQRATLWHELEHARRGDTDCKDDWFNNAQERSVQRAASRRAMPTLDLMNAIPGTRSYEELADNLKTTVDLLMTRLNALHPAERAAVKRLRERLEEVA